MLKKQKLKNINTQKYLKRKSSETKKYPQIHQSCPFLKWEETGETAVGTAKCALNAMHHSCHQDVTNQQQIEEEKEEKI